MKTMLDVMSPLIQKYNLTMNSLIVYSWRTKYNYRDIINRNKRRRLKQHYGKKF